MARYDLKDDGELIALLVVEDRSAFTEIFNRYNKLLYSHVFNKIRDEDTAQDVVQDIFVVLWEKRLHVKNINLSGYLFTMTRNRILNMLSHGKVVSDYTAALSHYAEPVYPNAEEIFYEKQLSAIIDEEIKALPPRMREIFMLSRFKHLSNKEIAAKLGLSEHTVADQIKKSLRTLRFKVGVRILLSQLFIF
ncbi:RNA polymerase sigma-70 factor [Sphingobacterium griseoflavum]|uniref:DNA-directed RNA polymerase sigma-70 factor n=1 Tax=Sphingobacterium griseoflavum TaxID=1474952 RepID=A0ABQ3I049_9SPHI|nr:RNA polymerase sigma-70 factor [Sphingobacterium griseoflavum]GHE44728.1 DNA-directed RNA polymerase sigma-70 factor [Sphingobacterium griseoflavum]